MKQVYLSGGSYVVGEIVDVVGSIAPADAIETLREQGLSTFARAKRDETELLVDSLAMTLRSSGLGAEDIGLVVCARPDLTTVYADYEALYRALHRCGLVQPELVHVAGASCANLHLALQTATDAIRSGRAAHVLVALYGNFPDTEPRVMPNNLAIYGDGAASCVLTTDAASVDYRICGSAQRVSTSLATLDLETEMASFILQHQHHGSQVCEEARRQAGRLSEDFRALIADNLGDLSLELALQQSGAEAAQLYRAPGRAFGHVHCADNLINLIDYTREQSPEPGTPLLLYGHGVMSWGALAIERM